MLVLPHMGGTRVPSAWPRTCTWRHRSPPAILEYDLGPWQPLRDDMLKDPIFDIDRIQNGMMPVPDRPGLGIEVDESVFARYPYRGGQVYPDLYKQLGAGRL